jgi:AraC-like DNA-binding protein
MLYRSYTPAPPLCDFVDCFWLYSDTPAHREERILPSGTIELVVNLRDDELRIRDPVNPDRSERYSGALVSGAYGRFFTIDAAQQESIIGVHFKPGGAFPFLGPPAVELADTHVDLESLWGRAAVELRERLCGDSTPGGRFRLLEASLMARLIRPMEHHGAVTIALDALERTDAGTTVRDIARRVGLSQQWLTRVFSAEVGMNPKLYRRVRRFQRAKAIVQRAPAPDWAGLAVTCGYFDQSHLIRDFRAFSGLCPSDYLRRRSDGVKVNHVPLSEPVSFLPIRETLAGSR